MGIDVWVPRTKPQPARPLQPVDPVGPVESAQTITKQAPAAAPRQTSASGQDAVQAPRISALSLESGGHRALIDDSTYQEGAFWMDLLRSSHGFDANRPVREGRFDWPIRGLPETDAVAAQKALLGFMQADTLVWIRGDALANLVFGAGQWQSFPERQQLGHAEAWVLGSDMDLHSASTRRALWAALEAHLSK